MSFTPFAFTKNWENPTDFPTYEENEDQVRADMQCLYDELKVGLNNLITELEKKTAGSSGAGNIGIEPQTASSLQGITNVMDAISALAQALNDAVISGIVPDNSITTAKILDSNVTTAKLADGSVTTPKLASGAVTNAKCDFSAGLTVAGNLTPQGMIILNSNCYGDELPAAGTPGRLFFKRVQDEE